MFSQATMSVRTQSVRITGSTLREYSEASASFTGQNCHLVAPEGYIHKLVHSNRSVKSTQFKSMKVRTNENKE